jgi:hypothetical protein
MDEDGFRVEVELDDEVHGYSMDERLRAVDLDDEARRRLGPSVMVTRDGPRLFLYAASAEQAHEAENVVQGLLEADELTADIRVTRWHPVEEAWKDVAIPLPTGPAEEAEEYVAREQAEAREVERGGSFDWHVAVHLPERGAATKLARRLRDEGLSPTRRWRYVTVGVLTEERAEQLADRLRSELPDDADVRIEVDLSDVARSPLQFLPF